MAVIVTGAAGFVGFHVAKALLARGEEVIGVDNLNAYYLPRLKQARLDALLMEPGYTFRRVDITDREAMFAVVDEHRSATRVVHLAAQAGVRHSMVDPYSYVSSNVMGHVTVLEAARRLPGLEHLVYASSSSVYGGNTKLPFAESDPVDTPVSLYAATKRAGELISHSYGHLYGVPQTGLRFFTVYGPWGRPDMAYYSFADAIMRGKPITVYDGGAVKRDFTYIDDIVRGVLACLDAVPGPGTVPRIFNIGNHRAEGVLKLVSLLEEALGRRAVVQTAPRPVADVGETCADLEAIETAVGFAPSTTLEEGVPRFAAWFADFHRGEFETPLTRRA